MTPSEIKELRDQVRGLMGADREVDLRIAALFNFVIGLGLDTKSYVERFGLPQAHEWESAGHIWRERLPRYTGSTDAALALSEKVLPGAVRRVYDDPENDCSGCDLITLDGRSVRGSGAKWEHAIIDATLTALI